MRTAALPFTILNAQTRDGESAQQSRKHDANCLLVVHLPDYRGVRPPMLPPPPLATEGNIDPTARRRARATISIMGSAPSSWPIAIAASSPSGLDSLKGIMGKGVGTHVTSCAMPGTETR